MATITDDLLPSVIPQLGLLVRAYEDGLQGCIYHATLFKKSSYKTLGRGHRRCKILASHDLAEAFDGAPTGYTAYRVTSRGLAVWDRITSGVLDPLPVDRR